MHASTHTITTPDSGLLGGSALEAFALTFFLPSLFANNINKTNNPDNTPPTVLPRLGPPQPPRHKLNSSETKQKHTSRPPPQVGECAKGIVERHGPETNKGAVKRERERERERGPVRGPVRE